MSGNGLWFKITSNTPINLGHDKFLVKEIIMLNFKLFRFSTKFLKLGAKYGVYLFEQVKVLIVLTLVAN